MKRMMNFVNALIVIALTLAGCSDEGTGRRPEPNPQQPPKQETTFQVNPDWTLSHNREVITDENGFRADVDVITVRSLDQETYWLDVLTAENFELWYKSDVVEYIKDEPNFYNGELYKGTNYIQFDRMRSGKWIAVAFGMTSDKKPTGDYAILEFTLEEDVPEADFTKWLGDWKITGASKSDPSKEISYDLKITSSDANYLVNITGWEKGKINADDTDMSDYILEAQYDRFTKTLLFKSLYLETEKIDGKEYDLCFYGNFYYDGSMNFNDIEVGEHVVTDNIIIAESTKLSGDGTNAKVEGLNFNFEHNNRTYKTVLTSMQYYAYPLDENDLGIYSKHNDVPVFPLTMTRTSATVAGQATGISAASRAKFLKIRTGRFNAASHSFRQSSSDKVRQAR